MTQLDVNFNDVPMEMQPLPVGKYLVDVVGAPKSEMSQTGKPKLVCTFAVVEGPDGDVSCKGRQLFDHISMTLLTRIKRLAVAAGLDPDADGLNTDSLVGCRLSLVIKDNTYTKDGETKTNSKIVDYVCDN